MVRRMACEQYMETLMFSIDSSDVHVTGLSQIVIVAGFYEMNPILKNTNFPLYPHCDSTSL